MTMPDLFEQLDSPAENGDDWIRRLLSEPDETPSPTPAAGDDGTDTGHEPDLPQEEERIVPPRCLPQGRGRHAPAAGLRTGGRWRCDGSPAFRRACDPPAGIRRHVAIR